MESLILSVSLCSSMAWELQVPSQGLQGRVGTSSFSLQTLPSVYRTAHSLLSWHLRPHHIFLCFYVLAPSLTVWGHPNEFLTGCSGGVLDSWDSVLICRSYCASWSWHLSGRAVSNPLDSMLSISHSPGTHQEAWLLHQPLRITLLGPPCPL